MSNSYVIFAGNSKDCLEPIKAVATEDAAIKEALLETGYRYIEVIFMPEDNPDINKIVYSQYK
jgi:hypothetical protein